MTNPNPPVIQFNADTTLRWACRERDFILWMRLQDVFSQKVEILDVWRLRDGDVVTLSNRIADLPVWFPLHPQDISGSASHTVLDELNSGRWCPDAEPMESENVWRAQAGDRLGWVGTSRPGWKDTDGVLGLVDFYECALVIGEPAACDGGELVGFGAVTGKETEVDMSRVRHVYDLASKMGCPRTMSAEWSLKVDSPDPLLKRIAGSTR